MIGFSEPTAWIISLAGSPFLGTFKVGNDIEVVSPEPTQARGTGSRVA